MVTSFSCQYLSQMNTIVSLLEMFFLNLFGKLDLKHWLYLMTMLLENGIFDTLFFLEREVIGVHLVVEGEVADVLERVPFRSMLRSSKREWSDRVATCGFDQRFPPSSTSSSNLTHLPTKTTTAWVLFESKFLICLLGKNFCFTFLY